MLSVKMTLLLDHTAGSSPQHLVPIAASSSPFLGSSPQQARPHRSSLVPIHGTLTSASSSPSRDLHPSISSLSRASTPAISFPSWHLHPSNLVPIMAPQPQQARPYRWNFHPSKLVSIMAPSPYKLALTAELPPFFRLKISFIDRAQLTTFGYSEQ